MTKSRLTLKLLNGVYDFVAGAMVLTAALFAAYSIWDNAQIYRSATDVQDSIRQYRPVMDESGDVLGFDELRAINSDVIAWLTMEGVNIDYPILQGEDNLEYMNKDVFGDFSLAGSIFLDTRCSPDLLDRYSLIYGHNMDQHLMFGDLALYKDKTFFNQHTTGEILTPDGKQDYNVVAVLQIPAGTEEIFNPDKWQDGFQGMADYLRTESIWYHSDMVDLIDKKPGKVQIVALVTCSAGSTNDRTALLLIRERPDLPDTHSSHSGGSSGSGSGDRDSDSGGSHSGKGRSGSGTSGNGPKKTGDGQDPAFWYKLIGGILVFITLFETVDRFIQRRKEEL